MCIGCRFLSMTQALWLDVAEYMLMLMITISIPFQITGLLKFLIHLISKPWSQSTINFCHIIVIFCSDGETFVSADDLRINLWNLEISNQSFNIVDVKPANMEDLTGINFMLYCSLSGSFFSVFLFCARAFG